ncbi:amidase signature domain-containing protein [Syncephalis fuscata]|nr:amidase signature domain-containing protein [Syncephalis fuscata]
MLEKYAAAKRCRERRAIRDKQLKKTRETLASPEIHPLLAKSDEILALSTLELRNRLAQRIYTAEQVLAVMLQAAINANEYTNAITEVLLDEAFEEARRLDKLDKPKGPLHGIPVSIKDNIDVAGKDTTLGYSARAFHPVANDAPAVALVRSAGAIPFVKTNIPQGVFSTETYNPIFGRTNSARNKALISGGSSGGEGALIGRHGSILGLGNDLASSLRNPASINGIYSLKPTSSRIPATGNHSAYDYTPVIPLVCGPIGHDIDALQLLMSSIIDQKPWTMDPSCVAIPWVPATLPLKLRVAYYVDNGYVPASPVGRRAIIETVEKLQAAGHEVVEFKPPNIFEATLASVKALWPDGGQALVKELKGDPMYPTIAATTQFSSKSYIQRALISWYIRNFTDDPRKADILEAGVDKTKEEMYLVTQARDSYRKLFFDELAKLTDSEQHPVDVILSTTQVIPMAAHDVTTKLPIDLSFTLVYNLLDAPSGVIPAITFDKEKDASQDNISWWNDGRPINSVEAQFRNNYNAELFHGSPCGVMVSGRRFEDEHVLACMRVIDNVINQSN